MNNTNIGIETKGCPSYGGKYITINPKASITTKADDKFRQMTLMKYHAFFVIFEKAAKFEIVICCKV